MAAFGVKVPYHGADLGKLALTAMQAADNGKDWGRIKHVALAHGLVGSPKMSAYVLAKHGLTCLTKATALENATTGVSWLGADPIRPVDRWQQRSWRLQCDSPHRV